MAHPFGPDGAPRPFRFGIVASGARSGSEWAATARRLESAGFTSMLVPDVAGAPAPLIAIAAAAAATTRLRFTSYVAVAGLRPPGVLAWEAGTLQLLSDGRFELGLGPGRPEAADEVQRLGVSLAAQGSPIARVRAALDAVSALPAERRPPILLAAGGPRMLELAGKLADAVALGRPPLAPLEDLAAAADAVRAAAVGRARPPELAANLLVAGEGDVPDWVRQRMGVDPAALRAANAATLLAGTPTQMADELRRRRDRLGISFVTGGLHLMEALAPVVERLSGR